MAEPWSVTIDVVDGEGIIEVVGDNPSMLLLAGEPVAAAGYDNLGSVGCLAARAGKGATTAAEVKALTEWLADPDLKPGHRSRQVVPPDPDRLRPLLRLLRPWRYVMTAEIPARPFVVGVRDDPRRVTYDASGTAYWHNYPEHLALVLVPTDSWPPPDEATVRRYGHRIERALQRDGSRPAIVTLSATPDDEIAYVLDGHHKLEAYRRKRCDPLLVRLAPVWPFRPRPEQLRDVALPGAGPLVHGLRDQASGTDVLDLDADDVEAWVRFQAEHARDEDAENGFRSALVNLKQSIAQLTRMSEPDDLRVMLAAVEHHYGRWLQDRGRHGEAEQPLRHALAVRERLLGRDHPKTQETRRATRSDQS